MSGPWLPSNPSREIESLDTCIRTDPLSFCPLQINTQYVLYTVYTFINNLQQGESFSIKYLGSTNVRWSDADAKSWFK